MCDTRLFYDNEKAYINLHVLTSTKVIISLFKAQTQEAADHRRWICSCSILLRSSNTAQRYSLQMVREPQSRSSCLGASIVETFQQLQHKIHIQVSFGEYFFCRVYLAFCGTLGSMSNSFALLQVLTSFCSKSVCCSLGEHNPLATRIKCTNDKMECVLLLLHL